MERPKLRAEALIFNSEKQEVMVQCDAEESFYRLPGGSIEFGETAAESITRELTEEYNLLTIPGDLACVNENIFEFNGAQFHQCTLIHWCEINFSRVKSALLHNENPEIKLIWCTVDQLKQKPTYPEGIIDIILTGNKRISHLLNRKMKE